MSAMPFEDFETAYETLATAIDQAGPAREALFLTRLALVLGHELGDIAAFRKTIKPRSTDWNSNLSRQFCLGAPIDQLASCERQEFLMG